MRAQNYFKYISRIGCGLLVICYLASCSYQQATDINSELQNTHYLRAQQFLKEGLYGGALNEFLSVLNTLTEAPETHLEVGRLYLNHIQDPIGAIYHFKRYLEYKSHSEQAVLVRQLIQTAEKAFAKQLPGRPFENEVDRFDLMESLQQVRQENSMLKKEILDLRQKLIAVSNTSTLLGAETQIQNQPKSLKLTAADFTTAPNTQTRMYTISSGDTLSRISTKVYGVPTRWQEIYEANKAALENPHNLKLGQAIIIP